VSRSMERLSLVVLIVFFIRPTHATTISPAYAVWESSCSTGSCMTQPSPHAGDIERSTLAGIASLTSQSPVIVVRCTERIYTCGVLPFRSGTSKIALTFSSRTWSHGFHADATLGCLTFDCPRWDAVADVEAASTGVPEPGTIMLFMTGVAVLLTRCRWLGPREIRLFCLR